MLDDNYFSREFKWSETNIQHIFDLIDRVIPIESCQYNQILPLSIENNAIIVGVVNKEDQSVIDHVRSLTHSFNLALEICSIDSKTHQLLISSYLKFKNTEPKKLDEKRSLEDRPQYNHQNGNYDEFDSKDTMAHEISELDLQASASEGYLDKSINSQISKTPISQIKINPHRSSTISKYPSAPAQFLLTLSAPALWIELFGRLVYAGIGRIYFERGEQHGRILVSKNGSLQLSLDSVPLNLFQGVIDQVKKVGHLPLSTIKKTTKVEIEQYHDDERLLLRLRLVLGDYGEEGNIQILRGKALHFYQQKQMDELGESALAVAKQFERKLRQIRARTRINPSVIHALDELRVIEANIRNQLDSLNNY
jgi:hypothetical protein